MIGRYVVAPPPQTPTHQHQHSSAIPQLLIFAILIDTPFPFPNSPPLPLINILQIEKNAAYCHLHFLLVVVACNYQVVISKGPPLCSLVLSRTRFERITREQLVVTPTPTPNRTPTPTPTSTVFRILFNPNPS